MEYLLKFIKTTVNSTTNIIYRLYSTIRYNSLFYLINYDSIDYPTGIQINKNLWFIKVMVLMKKKGLQQEKRLKQLNSIKNDKKKS